MEKLSNDQLRSIKGGALPVTTGVASSLINSVIKKYTYKPVIQDLRDFGPRG